MRLPAVIAAAAAAVLLLAACPRGPAARSGPAVAAIADAPWELEDVDDWLEVRDQLWGLAPGEPRRADLRVQLAAAQADRAVRWLDVNRPVQAHQALLELARLWADEPAALAAELAPARAALVRARAVFARSGADAEVALVLVLLAEIDPPGPDGRDAHLAELDEVLAFADELSVAEHGPAAIRARPIQILEGITAAVPLPALVDRFVALVAERQAALSAALRQDGATFDLVRAHTDVVRSARMIASALARAGRAGDIAAHLAAITGIGADDDLEGRAARVAAADATARDWLKLGAELRGGSRDDGDDPAAARAAYLAGLARFPDDAALAVAAARAARDRGRVHEPIRLLEQARRAAAASGTSAGDADAAAADLLTDLYRVRLAGLAFNDRPTEARARLRELEAFFADLERAYPGRRWEATLGDGFATLGRGLVSQGELAEATALLERAVELDRDAEDLETLATVALKQQRWAEARRWAARGLAAASDDPIGAYRRARIHHLDGDAAAGLGDGAAAAEAWTDALSIWADFEGELPPAIAAERLIEAGELMWKLGERDRGLGLLDAAIDVDADGSDTHTRVVAFLVVRGEYERALDAFHRAVLSTQIGEYHQVYMALWMLAEARRRGVAADPLVVEFLEGRDGLLWHDDMARLATGRITREALAARAHTRGRRAELAYYTAVLGLGADGAVRPDAEVRALLEGVVATDMVMFFEYEMARAYLATLP